MNQNEIDVEIMGFRRFLIERRYELGWTQRDAAEALQWTKSKVHGIEHGAYLRLDDILHIVDVYGGMESVIFEVGNACIDALSAVVQSLNPVCPNCRRPLGRCSCHLDALCGKELPVDDGRGFQPFIEWAQKSLFLTHFTPQKYTPEYVETHRVALEDRGVECTRIVRFSPEHPEASEWLTTFFDKKTKKPLGKYKQYSYPEANDSRLDIAIIDGIYVVEIRWVPFDAKGKDTGAQDMFYAIKSPTYAKFRADGWDQHIQALKFKLEEIKTLDHLYALLGKTRQGSSV